MAAKKKISKKKAKKTDIVSDIKPEKNLGGRPKGSLNKTTLFKEVMKEGFEEKLLKDGFKVFDAVVMKAVEGDMTAAKMILDRVVPVTKAVDIDAITSSGTKGISIHIEQLVASTGKVGDTIEDGIVIDE